MFRRIAPSLVLWTLGACDPNDGSSTCEPSEEPALLLLENRTGGGVESVTATPCEGGDAQELALPAGGLAFSEQVTVELPQPGCWLLRYEGGGCTNEPPYTTSSDVCGGDTYAWTMTVDGRACAGGW